MRWVSLRDASRNERAGFVIAPVFVSVVTEGNNLQERKRLLWETCDAIIALPGGTGTYDELWEVACHNSVGFGKIPICVMNINGFYDGGWRAAFLSSVLCTRSSVADAVPAS
jgi:predicted Rossmann-fold nucleotide-binding protein